MKFKSIYYPKKSLIPQKTSKYEKDCEKVLGTDPFFTPEPHPPPSAGELPFIKDRETTPSSYPGTVTGRVSGEHANRSAGVSQLLPSDH